MKKPILLTTLFSLLSFITLFAQQGRVGVTVPTLEVNLFAKDVNNTVYLADGILINFNNIYSANVDNNDVRKVFNVADNLAIRCGNFNLIVERRPDIVLTDTVKLSLTSTRVGSYRFDIDPSVLSNYVPTIEAILIDRYAQVETSVNFINVTNYQFTVTTDAASKAWDRFVIVYKAIASTEFSTISAIRNTNNSVTIKWGAVNERSVSNYVLQQSNDGINFTDLGSITSPVSNSGANPTYSKIDATASKNANWYRVRLTNQNGSTKFTSIAMVAAVNETNLNTVASMSIYPNPVINKTINLHLDNQPKGIYTIVIRNMIGQIIRTEKLDVQNNMQRNININNLANGNYQASIIDANGKITNIAFVAN
jgi:Secretion system C-terminal sorting domain